MTITLEEAKRELRAVAYEGGRCPCCTQHVQIYRWSLYGSAIRMLAAMYREGGTSKFIESKAVKVPGQGGDATRLRHWGLVEQESSRRPDGGKSGFWRVTRRGERFLLGEESIPKYAWVFDGRCLRLGGADVSVQEALGKNFSYAEIMGWAG